MNQKKKVIAAAVFLSLAAVILAGLAYWRLSQNSIPAVEARSPKKLNIPDEDAKESVSGTVAGFSVDGAAVPVEQTPAVSSTPSAPVPGTSAEAAPGSYKLNFDMAVRKTPDYSGEKSGGRNKNATVRITEIAKGTKNSVWGKLADGGWICISDNEYVYLTPVK